MTTMLQLAMRNVTQARAAAARAPVTPPQDEDARKDHALDTVIARQATRIGELEVALAKAIHEKDVAESAHQLERENHAQTRAQLAEATNLATAKKHRSQELLIANQAHREELARLTERATAAEEKAVAAEQRAVAAEQRAVAAEQREPVVHVQATPAPALPAPPSHWIVSVHSRDGAGLVRKLKVQPGVDE